RSITVIGNTGATSPKRNITFLPIVGTIAAGTPITASENLDGHLLVSQEMVHNVQGAFVLRVKGDSMIDDHTMPSDFVIIKPQAHADSGELVAVMLGDEATVKRLQHQNGKVLLMPANSA